VNYVTNMGETRNPENPEPMTAAERMRGHRARQLGDDVPRVKRGPKPRKPQTLREASLEELIDEVSDRLTGRMADDSEVRELAFRGVVHSYQTSGDRLSFVSIEPFCQGVTNLCGARYLGRPSHGRPCAAPHLLRVPAYSPSHRRRTVGRTSRPLGSGADRDPRPQSEKGPCLE
jgi:hypothetical protein